MDYKVGDTVYLNRYANVWVKCSVIQAPDQLGILGVMRSDNGLNVPAQRKKILSEKQYAEKLRIQAKKEDKQQEYNYKIATKVLKYINNNPEESFIDALVNLNIVDCDYVPTEEFSYQTWEKISG